MREVQWFFFSQKTEYSRRKLQNICVFDTIPVKVVDDFENVSLKKNKTPYWEGVGQTWVYLVSILIFQIVWRHCLKYVFQQHENFGYSNAICYTCTNDIVRRVAWT